MIFVSLMKGEKYNGKYLTIDRRKGEKNLIPLWSKKWRNFIKRIHRLGSFLIRIWFVKQYSKDNSWDNGMRKILVIF